MVALVAALVFSGPKAIKVPALAHIAGFTLGLTTVQEFERHHGRGAVGTGGHSGGKRSWYDPAAGLIVSVDGFDFWHDREIVDEIWIDWASGSSFPKGLPRLHLSSSELGWLAKFRPGMRAKELAVAVSNVCPQAKLVQTGLIRYPEKPTNKDNDRYTKWELEVHAGGPEGLTGLRVYAQ